MSNGSGFNLGLVGTLGALALGIGGGSLGIDGGGGGLQSALISGGDSLAGWVGLGNSYGAMFATRLGGPCTQYPRSGFSLPGQDAAAVLAGVKARSHADQMKVWVIIAGRNGVLTDTAGTRAALLAIDAWLTLIGNVSGGVARAIYATVPFKPSEVTAGPGTTNYDLVAAHNTWLTGTAFAGRTFDMSDISNLFPSGDDIHPTDDGYDEACRRAAVVLKTKAWLPMSMPTSRSRLSMRLDSPSSKYVFFKPPKPTVSTYDGLPKAPNSEEMTLLQWFRAKDAASAGVIIGRYGASVNARCAVRHTGGNTLTGYYGGGVFASFTTTAPVDLGWHLAALSIRNITGTYKGDLGFDGAFVAAQQTCGAMSATPFMAIGEVGDLNAMGGGGAGTPFGFAGDYLPPVILNVGISSAQFLTIYNGGVPLAPAAMAQVANIRSYLDLEHILGFNLTRGMSDLSGTLDARPTGLTTADIRTNAP
jgi:hypothetical protein